VEDSVAVSGNRGMLTWISAGGDLLGMNALALVGECPVIYSLQDHWTPAKAVLGLTISSRVMPKLALLLKSSEVTITTVLLLPTPQDWYAVIVFGLGHCTPDGMEKSAGRVRVPTVPL